MAKVHVFCSRPGLHRGGRSNPKHAEYEVGEHSPEQLLDLLREPETTVVVGDLLTEKEVAEMKKAAKKAAATAG